MRRKRTYSRKPLAVLALLGILFVLAMPAAEYSAGGSRLTGRVETVSDGDTVAIRPVGAGKPFSCRLYGIDAPETAKPDRPGQPHGDAAKQALKKLIHLKTVKVRLTGEKTYNREVCIIYLGGTDVNREMIYLGHAWAYRKFLKSEHAREYVAAETSAKKGERGLWGKGKPIRPDKFKQLYWR